MKIFDWLLKDYQKKKGRSCITNDTQICGVCLSKDIWHGGSWSPPKCNICGSIYFWDGWYEDEK